MRSSLLDEIGEDYLTTARAKGLRDVVVRRRHAVRNALLPTTTVAALSIGFVVSGAITIETVFSIPGLGLLASEALTAPGLLGPPGHLPGRRGRRHPGQPRGQPGLRPPRPAGADMTTRPPPRPRLGRGPRPAAPGRSRCGATGRLFRSHRSGLLGLGAAAVLRRAGGVRAAARRPRRARPHQGHRRRARAAVAGVLARHRRQRPPDPDPADLRRPGLAVRRAVRHADLDGDRHRGRAAVRLPRGVGRHGPVPAHRVVPGASRSCRWR